MVAPVADFSKNNDSGVIRMCRIKEVVKVRGESFSFPRREVRDRRQRGVDVGTEADKVEVELADGHTETLDLLGDWSDDIEIAEVLEDIPDAPPPDIEMHFDSTGQRIRKRYKNSARPECFSTKDWKKLNAETKKELILADEALKAQEAAQAAEKARPAPGPAASSGSSSSSTSAATAATTKPGRKIINKKAMEPAVGPVAPLPKGE